MRTCLALPLALLLALCLAVPGLAEAAEPKYHNVSVHDPSIILADDGCYYIYGSHMQAARSTDLMDWKLFSRDAESGCRLVDNVQVEMGEALSYAKTVTFWAPDVQRLADGRYYMYYCCCEGSSPLSALGLAVSDAPEGPYKNLGVFLKSGAPGYDATHLPNVVDPNTFFDADGRLWMVYGSYSGGIFILEMDPETGFPLEGQGYGKKLLGRNHARIEAPYILYSPETGYYYLFLSFGGLNAADGYNIRVCRSEAPDGPYYDSQGNDMIDCGGADGTFFNDPDYEPYGVKLLGGYGFRWLEGDTSTKKPTVYRSPGHCSAIRDEATGRYFLVFHTRFEGRGEQYQVRVHQLFMNDRGWPVALPLRYSGEAAEPVDADLRAGLYKLILHGHDINTEPHLSVAATLNADGTVTGDLSGSWACEDGRNVALTLDGVEYRGVMNLGYDADEKAWLPCLTALDASGCALWGVRAVSETP